MFCKKCGTQLPDDAIFCMKCGSKLEDMERKAKRAAEKEEKEAKRAAEKEEKEAKKAAEKEEKEAKRAAEKEEKEAKKAAEKEEKEQRREERARLIAEKKAAKLDAYRNEIEGNADGFARKAIDEIIKNPNQAIAFLQAKILIPNWRMKVTDRRVFWDNIAAYEGWHIQENTVFGQWRILDPYMYRRCWGSGTDVIYALKELAEGDYSKKHFLGGFGYDAGHYDGQKDGYVKASQKYEEKLRDQAREFINQKKDWRKETDFYHKLCLDYEYYIEQLEYSNIPEEELKEYRSEFDKLVGLENEN